MQAGERKTGELLAAASFGKPLDCDDGYFDTPESLRMGFGMLGDGGYVPLEVELMPQAQLPTARACQRYGKNSTCRWSSCAAVVLCRHLASRA